MLNTMTFNICKDNAAAATTFAEALKAKGYGAEVVEVPAEAVAHAEAVGQKSPPASVAHDAPADVALKIAVEVEKNT